MVAALLLYQLAANLFVMLMITEVILLAVVRETPGRRACRLNRLTAAAACGALATIIVVVWIQQTTPSDDRVTSSLTLVTSTAALHEKLTMFSRAGRYIADEVFLGARCGPLAVAAASMLLGVSLFRHFRRTCGLRWTFVRLILTTALWILLGISVLASQAFNSYNLLFWRVLVGGAIGYGFLWTLLLRLNPPRLYVTVHRLSLFLGGVVAVLFLTVDNYYHLANRMKNAEDYAMINRIADRLETHNPDRHPVALVTLGVVNSGIARPKTDIHSELMAGAMLAPWSRDTIWRFLGIHTLPTTPSHLFRGCELGRTMDLWPAAASVRIEGDLAVIKLGEADSRCVQYHRMR
jgi:hypothetical protein